MSSLFGGGSNSYKSSSTNQAYPTLANDFSGTISNATGAGNLIANMLGLNGPAGQQTGFNNWRNSTGYQFGLNQGLQSINGNAAAQGLLNSGATGKALMTYGQNYANTQYGNYVNQLQALLGSGLQAGGILSSAGNVSNSSGSGNSTNGLFGNNGAGAAGLGQLINKGASFMGM